MTPSAAPHVSSPDSVIGPRARRLSTAAVFAALVAVVVTTGLFVRREDAVPTWHDYLARSSVAGKSELTAGVSTTPAPSGVPTADLAGFDMMLADYLSRSLGMTARLVPVAPQDRLRALEAGRVDVIIAALTMTVERQQRVDFAGPYLVTGTALLVRSTTKGDARTLLARRDSPTCIVVGSLAGHILERQGVSTIGRQSLRECVAALESRQVDAVASDTAQLVGYADRLGGAVRLVAVSGAAAEYGIAVPKGDPYLRELVQSFLIASKAKGDAGVWSLAYHATLGRSASATRAGMSGTQPNVTGLPLQDADDRPIGASLPPPAGHRTSGGRSRPVSRPPRQPVRRAVRRARRRAVPAPPGAVPPPEPHSDPSLPAAPTAGAPARSGATRQEVWSLLVGVPAAVSALYLWIQSGGDRQFTLLLAQAVNPIAFFATIVLSSLWLFLAAPAILFAVCGTVVGSVDGHERAVLLARHPIVARACEARCWVVVCTIGAAAICSPLLYVPAWALALCMARGTSLFRRSCRLPATQRLACRVAVPGAAAVLVLVSLADGKPLYAAIAAWPVAMLAAGADTPMLRSRISALIRLAAVVVAALAVGMVAGIIRTPILPSTVVEVSRADAGAGNGDAAKPDTDVSRLGPGAVRWLRGYAVSVDDESTTMLWESGGLAIIPNGQIRTRVLCPSVTDLPGSSPQVWGLPVSDSVLRHLARRQRPAVVQDPRCRIRADTWGGS